MNSYKLSSKSVYAPFVLGSGTNIGYLKDAFITNDQFLPYLRAVTYITAFADDLDVLAETVVVLSADGESTSSFLNTALNVDLPFSLSNLTLSDDFLTSVLYDTTSQGVREYLDRPYPNRGNLVAVFALDSAGNYSDPTSDLDDYIKFPVIINFNGTVKTATVFIGACNSSRTDFYRPFELNPFAVFFDLKQALERASQQAVNQAAQTVGSQINDQPSQAILVTGKGNHQNTVGVTATQTRL